MRSAGTLLISLLILALSGCTAVYVAEPIGEKPCKIEAQEWEGTWLHKDGTLTMKVMDGEKGLLKIAWVEPKEETLALESLEVQLWESGSWVFANTKEDSADEAGYLWARIKQDGKQVVIWLPDEAKFKVLVEQGKLPGRIERDGDVILDRLEPQHLSLITGEQEGVLFAWDQPVVLIRYTREGN
jgi:hypothetical protein